MSVLSTEQITSRVAASVREKVNVEDDQLRSDAIGVFQQLGLPELKHEEYKYTPIARYLEKNFTFTPSDAPGPLENVNEFLIDGLEANVMVFIDGAYSIDHSRLISPGIRVVQLEEALAAKDKIALEHFSKYVNYKTDALAAWNTAGWHNGLFVHIPDGKIVERPIIIYHLSNATAGEIVAVNRNLFVIGANSRATIVEKQGSTGGANHFSNLVTEVVLLDNARLDLFSIQDDTGNRFHYGLTEIYQQRSSFLNTYTFSLRGKLLRNNLHLQLDGEGIESHMYGLYLLGKDTLADNHTVVDHKKPHSFSNELYKGVMDDNSKGVFNGKIFVRPQAQKTNAFQANRNILLTDTATVNTKPQLEIWADDVKCSHGCTTGQLDEEALFYLQSRGLGKDTARAMMLYAFAAEVLEKVKEPVLNAYLDSIVSDRLHKNF